MRTYNMTMPTLTSVRGQTLLTDTKPYLYRQSPIVAQMIDLTLTGGTVAWNQLTQNGDFASTSGWGAPRNTLSASGNVLSATLTQVGGGGVQNRIERSITGQGSHKFLISVEVNPAHATNVSMAIRVGTMGTTVSKSVAVSTGWSKVSTILTNTGDLGLVYYAVENTTQAGYAVGDVDQYRNAQLFDLTLMFGSTIADYVYSLETQTAGSGIAWLKSFGFFSKDFFPFDSGSLLSVKTSAHKTVGKNLLNAPNINGTSNGVTITQNGNEYTLTGTASAYTQRIETGERVLRAGTYTLTAYDQGTGVGVQLRSTDGLTTYATTAGTGTQTFTLANDTTVKCRIYVNASTVTGGRTVKLQLELGTTATYYKPYESHTYPLSDIELRGVPKLTDGQIVYDGDAYESSGTVTRRFGIASGVFSRVRTDSSGTLWLINSASIGMKNIEASILGNLLTSAGLSVYTLNDLKASGSVGIASYSGSLWIGGYIGRESELDTLLQTLVVLYELATPTSETTDAFENPQVAGSTEEYVDERTVPMPVGHVTEYFNMEQIKRVQMFMPKED